MTDQTPRLGHRPTSGRLPLPVFPFTDAQVAHVADALASKLHWLRDEERATELARVALKALAQVMRMESERDPMGCPSGYGYRQVRAVTDWFLVDPDGKWERIA